MRYVTILVINTIVVHHSTKYKKDVAIEMRKRGFSYSEIHDRLGISKSTLSFWLAKIKVDDYFPIKMKERQLEALRRGVERKKTQAEQAIETIKNSSSKDIGKISAREMWLMGVVLYWKERLTQERDNDLKRGFRFSSADGLLIQFILKWLRDIGKIEDHEIIFDIFAHAEMKNKTADIIDYWASITKLPSHRFTHIYFQKTSKSLKRKSRRQRQGSIQSHGPQKSNPQPGGMGQSHFGFLRIRVKASSLLVRQIAGWVKGIQEHTIR
jgi:predicted transcriptional regulator